MGRIVRLPRAGPTEETGWRTHPGAAAGAQAAARAVIDAAAEEARAVVAAAHREAERIRADAAEAGRADSARVRAQAEEERERLRAEHGPALLRLALAAAARVVERAVADDAVAVAVAARALGLVGPGRQLVLRAHPADAPGLCAALPRLRSAAPRAEELAIREDPEVGRGGVVVETGGGQVDGRVETRLAAVARAVAGEGIP